MVENGATDPWSEECYLNDDCAEQGNPCSANDVTLIGVFIADSVGGPVPACTIGDTVDVLLWGTFINNTGTNRYAIRSRVEVFIEGVFHTELNACSFDVLAPGSSDAALIGSFTYVCGDQVSIVNTWVGWSTSAAQCSNPGGANYNNVCNEYPPSKCSKDLDELIFLTPNFSYDCGEVTSTTTEVCFNNLTFGGTPPLTYLWEFGDGDTSTLENPCHTYMATTGSFIVVLTVTDSNGIMAGVQLTLDLDSLACCNLTILCPAADGGTFECIEDVPDPDPGLITVVDSCSETIITSVDSISGTGCGLDTMFITRYYIIADSVQTDSCIQVFKVIDDIAPVITVCPADVTVECDNLVPDADITLVTATDNCAGMVVVTFGGDVLSDSTCANRYTLTRTYVATDGCNNSSTCNQVITVFDDTPPSFTFVPANTTVNCNDTPVFGMPTATDNCGDAVTITFTDSSAPAANCAGGTVTRLWTATDVCGNSATASQTLTFVDTEAPVFTSVPSDATISCDSIPVFGTVTVIDSCDTMVTLDSTTTTAPMANCAGGTTTRTWTATDNCGNTATASQTFTFIDIVTPVFTFVPADATISCSTIPVFGTPVATDNCDTSVALDSVTTSETISNCAGGSTTRTWTATDNCGNTATASQTLTFMDVVAPTIMCPADVTVECDESTLPPDTGTATATDDCGGTPVVTFSDVTVGSMICAQEYSITRTWLATDDCDNTATCVQTIIVDDSTPPDLTCPPDVIVDCEDSTAPDSTGVATATDNCDTAPVVAFSDVTVQGICPQEFTVTRTWTATDECGNSTACVQVVMVQDTTPPTFNPDCQAEFTFFTSEGSACPTEAEVSLEVGQIVGEAETWIVGGNEIPGLNGCLFDNCGDSDSLEARVDSIVYDGDNCSVAITIYFTILNDCDTNNVNLFVNVVTILDDEAPMLTCPADITINCEDSTSPDSTGMATATDNCQLVGLTFTDSIVPGLCPQEMTIFRTWMADDSCGNMSSCLQIITVQDTAAPMLVGVPADVTVQCDSVPPPPMVTATDNCTEVPTVFPASSLIPGNCLNNYTIFRSWLAVDECGNSSTASQTVTVIDTQAPSITCPANVTVQCASMVPGVNVDSVVTSDNCEGTVIVTHVSDTITNMICVNRFTVTRTYLAMDVCGNSATCAQTITVFDNTAPVITCPANITVNCEDDTLPPATGEATASDNCAGLPAIDYDDVTIAGACPQEFTITRTWIATDSCGNTGTCVQTITVDDSTAPTITCPADLTIECTESTFPANTGMATAIDSCDLTPEVTYADITAAGACASEYTITRTWTATDTCGNSSSCIQTITVDDSMAPVITCPVDLTIECTESTLPANTGMATAIDSCDLTPEVTYADVTVAGSCPQEYTITRTWTATDTCGNSSSCTQTITVDDSMAPTITCPADVTIECTESTLPGNQGGTIFQEDFDGIGGPTAGGAGTYSFPSGWLKMSVDNLTPHANVSYVNEAWERREDFANNVADSAAFSTSWYNPAGTANDWMWTPPISIGANGMLNWNAVTYDPLFRDGYEVRIMVAPDVPTGGTGVIGNMITNSTVLFSTPAENTAWTARNVSLAAYAGQTVRIAFRNNSIDKFLLLIDDVVVTSNATATGIATATDECDPTPTLMYSDVTIAGACPQEYTITRTWTATDTCGNSSSCIQTITVDDSMAPVITCPADVTIECDESSAPDSTGVATAIDDCQSEVAITSTDQVVPGNCPQEMTILRTWLATDSCGNASTCVQIITVQDTTPPVAIFIPPDITIECDENIDSVLAEVPIFMDNCDPDVPALGSIEVVFNELCPQGPTLIQAWSGVDDCGNSTTVGRTVVVIDTTGPVITCPADVTIECTDDTSTETNGFATATDNCDSLPVVDFSDAITEGECPQEYTINRTWVATDACGNSNTCVQAIFVIDTTPPVMTCPANLTVECADSVPPANIDSVTATDNCGIAVITYVGDNTSDSTCINRFTVTRVYQATDECGNSSTCAQIITVFDGTAPVITCPANVTVQCASQVPAVNTGSVVATDNCGGTATITHDGDVITNQTCVNRFTLTRTYRATDECGNSATCAQIITVFDNTPPAITCPANVTVQCASQVPAVNTGSVVASDNCGGTTTITHVGDVISNMTCVNRFTLTRTYRATDECGNSATCAQIITVFDNTPPTITCPAPVTVQCASDVPPVNTASVVTSDNCAGTVTVTHVSDNITNMTCLNRFTLTRTYRATDECGNSATCTQVITVFDNTPPVITFDDPLLEGVPNGGTVEVQCFGQDPEWELPSFDEGSIDVTDNCAGTVTVVFTDNLIDEGDCQVDGYINLYRLDWVATDACGNSSSAFVFLALIDTIPPEIQNVPADITVNCDEIPAPPTDIFATDECLCACLILFDESDPDPGCQNGQIVTRTWTAEDDCGNITVEVQNITLIDNEGPELIMMLPELEGVQDGAIFEYTCNEGGIPAFFDLLDGESVYSPVSCGTSGNINFTGETIIANNCKFWGYIENRIYSWKAIDQCGNTSSFVITARLIDTEPPVIVGVPDTTCIGDPALDEIEVIDNCDNASLIYWDVPIANPCGADDAIFRTYEGYDDCGNTVRDTAILIPNDQSHPEMVFIDPVLAELEFGEILIVECDQQENGQYTSYGPGDVDFIDACMPGVTIVFSENVIEAGDCTEGLVAVIELLWTATDLCGNLGEARIMAHVVDNTNPEFENFEVEITIDCGDELPEVFANDNCGDVVIETIDSIVSGPCVYEYDVIRTHTATDPCGNSTVRKQLIHVGDGSGPIIEGVVEEVCDDLSIPDVTALDPCTGEFVEVTMIQDTLDVPCKDGMVIERIWTAVDACGNVAQVKQHIVLGDQTPPEIQIPTYSVILRFYGYFNNLVLLSQENIMDQLNALNAGSVFVLDDCDQEIDPVFSLVVTYADDCEEEGYFERRTYSWLATDVCGNSDEISFTVDIMDDIPPVLMGVPENTTIICNGLPPVPVVTAQDPALPVVIEYSQFIGNGDGPGEFVVTRTWTATDACGNSSQATQSILWIPDTFLDCDILLPGPIECNTHGVLIGSDVSGGLGEISYLWEIEGEKCFIQGGQGTPEIFIYVGWSEVDIKLTVTDAFGCSSVCSITLNCLDPFENNFIINPHVINPETEVQQSMPNNSGADLHILEHFNLFPNPANASVNLSFESSLDHEVEYVMTNFLGQVVLSEGIKAVKGFNSRKIDVSNLPDGSYLMQLVSEKETRTRILVLFRNN